MSLASRTSGEIDRVIFPNASISDEPNGILFEIATDWTGVLRPTEPLETLGAKKLALAAVSRNRRREAKPGLKPIG